MNKEQESSNAESANQHFSKQFSNSEAHTFTDEVAFAQNQIASELQKANHKRKHDLMALFSLVISLVSLMTTTTPHMLRHSLARRMLAHGAKLPEDQRVLWHSRLSTTGIYLTPSEEDVRLAISRTGI